MNEDKIYDGRRIAHSDYKKYKLGELTYADLASACEYSKWCALAGDEDAQGYGYGYLLEMQDLGIIKNLRRVD